MALCCNWSGVLAGILRMPDVLAAIANKMACMSPACVAVAIVGFGVPLRQVRGAGKANAGFNGVGAIAGTDATAPALVLVIAAAAAVILPVGRETAVSWGRVDPVDGLVPRSTAIVRMGRARLNHPVAEAVRHLPVL